MAITEYKYNGKKFKSAEELLEFTDSDENKDKPTFATAVFLEDEVVIFTQTKHKTSSKPF